MAGEKLVLRLALKEPFGSQGADPAAEFTALQRFTAILPPSLA